MTTLTASIVACGPGSVLHRTVLASLPNSYRVVEGAADIVLVSGTDPTVAERAVARGARAVVLDQPGALSLEELMALENIADQHGCIVVPAPRYAPRFDGATDLVDAESIDLVESTITSPQPSRSAMVEQLALMRQVLGSVATLRVLHSSGSHFVAEATMVDHPRAHVVLNGVTSRDDVEEVSLRAIGVDRHLSVRIDAGTLARPADISVFDDRGRQSPWPLHQHAHRITLTFLHRMLTTVDGFVSYPIEQLRQDVARANALTD